MPGESNNAIKTTPKSISSNYSKITQEARTTRQHSSMYITFIHTYMNTRRCTKYGATKTVHRDTDDTTTHMAPGPGGISLTSTVKEAGAAALPRRGTSVTTTRGLVKDTLMSFLR